MTKKILAALAATALSTAVFAVPAQAAPCSSKPIPSVVGLRAKDATVKLHNAGFWKITVRGTILPYKTVKAQLPAGRTYITPCGPVFLTMN